METKPIYFTKLQGDPHQYFKKKTQSYEIFQGEGIMSGSRPQSPTPGSAHVCGINIPKRPAITVPHLT